jgi:hypothetical protein
MRIMLKNVRLLYGAALFTPQRGPEGTGEPKHSGTFAFPKDHPAVAAIKKGFEQVAKEKWGAKAVEVYTMLKAGDRLCLRDGDAKADKEGYKGNLYISASNKLRPLIIDGQKQPIDANSGLIYSGCFVNAEVEIWAQDNKFGKRMNATLRGVQKVRDGQRLAGGGVSSADDYEAIPDSDDAGAGATPAAAGAAGSPNPFD